MKTARKSKTGALSPAALAMIAARFGVLSDPSRLALLHALMDGERSVGDLAAKQGLSHANASKHLAMLAEAGFAQRRREGLFSFYSLADNDVFALCDLMCSSIARKLGRDLREVA